VSARRRRRNETGQTASDVAGPSYRVTSYSVYPTGYDQVDRPGKERWTLSIEDAGNGWAIRRDDRCLSIALQWEQERPPELCDSQFLRRCRYNEHAALLRARRVVDRLEVLGLTFAEFVAQALDRPADSVGRASSPIAGTSWTEPVEPSP
jgi:hypothetical protein